jgi:molecular chaperone HtpG
MQFEEPLFHIHLNVDYLFNWYFVFSKISSDLQIQKDKIQLYQNQVYVTDNVEGIVPEFLMMLKGGRFSRHSIERIAFRLAS